MSIALGRNWVEPAGMKRVTFANSLHRQPGAFNDSMVEQAFLGIARTGRMKTANLTKEWRNGEAVEPDEGDEEPDHWAPPVP